MLTSVQKITYDHKPKKPKCFNMGCNTPVKTINFRDVAGGGEEEEM